LVLQFLPLAAGFARKKTFSLLLLLLLLLLSRCKLSQYPLSQHNSECPKVGSWCSVQRLSVRVQRCAGRV
jgi:hypothetical protein